MQILKQYWYILIIAVIMIGWFVMEDKQELSDNEVVVNMDSMNDSSPVAAEEELTTTSNVMVDIKGAVKNPGVYELQVEDRVKGAIQQAGGFRDDADSNQINLAERVYDEMVIYIPSVHEQDMDSSIVSRGDQNGKIRVNLATKEELTTLPGIGEAKAAAIIEYREENGKFTKIEDLTEISGIGEKTVERLAEFILVP